jgi:membrane protein
LFYVSGSLYVASLELVWQVINFAVSFIIVTGLFSLIFKLLLRVTAAWKDVLFGQHSLRYFSMSGSFLLASILNRSGFGVWGSRNSNCHGVVYYSAQIFLLGAEFTWIYAGRFGSRKNINHNGNQLQI